MKLSTIATFLFFYIGLCFNSISQVKKYDTSRLFSIDELKSDFRYLRQKLEKRHPNLYLYTSKEGTNAFFDSIENSIQNPYTEREFYHLLSLMNSRIKDGHTMILPSQKATDYYNSNCNFLPFYFYITSGKIQVLMNCSSNNLIKEGNEILSINGIPTNKLLDELTSRSVRDGENKTYPQWILTNYFKEYYSFSYGHPKTYSILFKNNEGIEIPVSLNALSKDSIRYYKSLKYPSSSTTSEAGKGIYLTINETNSTAILTIKSFDRQLLRNKYNQHFSNEIKDAFTKIKDLKTEHLVVDIRNNQGGDFEPGRELLSYLIIEPVVYLKGSAQERTIKPTTDAFKNKLYVLINGGSFSNSGIVSSYLAMNKRGVFYGEETAGNSTILSGEPIDIVLPNTGLNCQVSTQSFEITKENRSKHGVQPDVYIQPKIESLIAGKDEIMETVLAKINLESKK